MFKREKVTDLNEYFTDLNGRRQKGVFFSRINGYNEQIGTFVQRYYEEARKSGVIIEGKIPNPDDHNLSYYNEIMGMDFYMDRDFICTSLGRWLPRMNDYQRGTVADAIYGSLDRLMKDGKNLNMLKNAYIKFMCWLYYKFERIVSRLGENIVPKILYEGTISQYELLLFSVLSGAGCDIVLLQYSGDSEYTKLDPGNRRSDPLQLPQMTPFPQGYSLKKVRQDIQEQLEHERLYGEPPSVVACTNAWISGKGLEDARANLTARGQDPHLFYNCFYRIRGVEDKLIYLNELYQFQLEIRNSGRKLVITDDGIPAPSPEEISHIQRGMYTDVNQMISGLSANIHYRQSMELQKIMRKAFIDLILAESRRDGMNLNKLTNKAVYLLCWLERYGKELFGNWVRGEISCFIYFGACKSSNEILFLRMLARLPADVILFEPNLNETAHIEDPVLYEISYNDSMVVSKYQKQNAEVHMGTAAYHAERELDTIMYRDSGIYRNQQYEKANAVTLQTMYEEIEILWDQELKYRPNFSVVDEVVTLPVVFAKISGVKDGDVNAYWSSVKRLLIEDTVQIKRVPNLSATDVNPMKAFATEFLKNGRVQKRKIKEHKQYKYSVLRDEMQDYILEKLQELLDQKALKGTFENGTEYTIVSTVLNMDKDIVRLIQKFDFTKKNPKLVYFCVNEETLSLEDSIMAAFLNRIGFDILFFVPTGYQVVEKYFQVRMVEEHQIGEFIYDLAVPDFNRISSREPRRTWRGIFKRGT